MKRKFLEVAKLADVILFGGDVSSEAETAFFRAANDFLSQYRARVYCNEVRYFIERVDKKIVFNA